MKNFINEQIEKYLSEGYMDKFRNAHGPLMKAGSWLGKRSLEKLVNHEEIKSGGDGHKTLYVGAIHDPWDKNKSKPVAVLSHGKPDPKSISSGFNRANVGYDKHHQWYEDTGLGYKSHSSTLKITGHVHIHPDGNHETHGNVDMKKSHNLMVYK